MRLLAAEVFGNAPRFLASVPFVLHSSDEKFILIPISLQCRSMYFWAVTFFGFDRGCFEYHKFLWGCELDALDDRRFTYDLTKVKQPAKHCLPTSTAFLFSMKATIIVRGDTVAARAPSF